jgi:hypothetical protein
MTRATISHHVAAPPSCFSGGDINRPRVTLPAPPDGLSFDADARTDTRPRAPTIRGDSTWQRDPVLRHADTRRDRG